MARNGTRKTHQKPRENEEDEILFDDEDESLNSGETHTKEERIKNALKENLYNEMSIIYDLPNQNFYLHASAGARAANMVLRDMGAEGVTRQEVSDAFQQLLKESCGEKKAKKKDVEMFFLKIRKECAATTAIKRKAREPAYDGCEI